MPRRPSKLRTFVAGGVAVAIIGSGLVIRAHFAGKADAERVAGVVASEELILALTPELKNLGHDILNLQLPGPGGRDLFAPVVAATDLGEGESGAGAAGALRSIGATASQRSLAEPRAEVARDDLALWRPLLDQVDYFEHAGFKIVRGRFEDTARERFVADIAFSGLACLRDASWSHIHADQEAVWERAAGTDATWQIREWRTVSMEQTSGRQRLFSDRLDSALPDALDRQRARYSKHAEGLVVYYESGKTRALSHEFAPMAMNQKPAVSVVDIDGDGFDDIYVMVRAGRNLLLRNNGDGTFAERAVELELAIPGRSTAGLFADFDNDGDPDLMLGRSIERCLYLENTGGWFREVEQPIDLPFLATSLSAADYNGDGLLDVYISTYRRGALGAGVNPGFLADNPGGSWPDEYLTPEQAAEFRRRYAASRGGTSAHGGYLDQAGPPNVLLVNRGGGQFEIAPENPVLELWKNTLQATWADYDQDGDPDLFVAHDWAPDNLFRNDGAAGFTNVSTGSGVTAMGFGMGASWGDYDQDGLDDIYVSNMYSKAGRRILAQFGEMDPAFMESAEGNFLYRQSEPGRFELVSGLKSPKLQVAAAGWSWGGQFADIDNDSDLDIYALSGYFSPPDRISSQVDL